MLHIRRIVGESMLPTLRPDAIVIALQYRQPKVGDIVVVEHNSKELIKRVFAITDKQLDIRGDNMHKSTDSRHFGLVKVSSLKGIVVWPRH